MTKFANYLYENYSSNEVISIIRAHNIEALFFDCMKKDHMQASLSNSNDVIRDTVLISFLMKERLRESMIVIEALNASRIDYAVVKGIALTPYYEKDYYRVMGDLDIWVKPSDLCRVECVLSTIGFYKPIQEASDKDITYVKPEKLAIELHFSLFNMGTVNDSEKVTSEFWEGRTLVNINGIDIKTLSPVDHFRYLILHKVVHMLYSGFGIKQLIDVVKIVNFERINCKEHVEYFVELGYGDFYKAVIELCETYFDMKVFYDGQRVGIHNAMHLQWFLDLLINNGAFGNHSEELKLRSFKTYLQARYHKRLKLPAFVYAMFPTPNMLTLRYNYAKKYPVLLPFAWVHRLAHTLVRRDINYKMKLFFLYGDDNYSAKERVLKSLKLQ